VRSGGACVMWERAGGGASQSNLAYIGSTGVKHRVWVISWFWI